MKKICSCLILAIFFSSCNLDESSPTIQNSSLSMDLGAAGSTNRIGDVFPANSDNPCDLAGKLHNEVLTAYYASENLPTNLWAIAARVKTVAYSLPGFVDATTPLTKDTDVTKVQYILSHPDTCISDIVAELSMSPSAKINFNSFLTTTFILMPDDIEYSVLHEFVCTFERDILTDVALTEKDKRIILTTSAIVRYSVYQKKKRPKKNTDADWNLMIANIIGGAYGANNDTAEAITTALTAGIAQNQ